MSYSFGFQVENASYSAVSEATRAKFEETYPEPADEVKDAVHRLSEELPYLAQQFMNEEDTLPDGTILNVTVSGHEHVDEDDQAPRFQSITLTLNKKPEPVEAEAKGETVAEDDEAELATAGAGGKSKAKA